MKPWEYLVESDTRSRELLKTWQQSGSEQDFQAWLRSLRGRNVLSLLKANAPARPEDVSDDIAEALGDGLYLFAWADAFDAEGDGLGAGMDYADHVPPTPRRALRSGGALLKAIERQNRPLTISQLYWVAQNMPGRHSRDVTPKTFGFAYAAESLGQGISWSDDHPDPEIATPHWEFSTLYR